MNKNFAVENLGNFITLRAIESNDSIPLYNTQAELQLLSKLKNQSYKAYIGSLKQLPTRDISTDLMTTTSFDITRADDQIIAGGLIPTQREIFLDAIVSKLTPESTQACFTDPVELAETPIITFNDTFVIDGHHRWANICMINPRAACKVINFREYNLTPIQFLKLLQGAIVMKEGELPKAPENTYDVDIFHSSNKVIREFIQENVGADVLSVIRSSLDLKDIDSAREYMVQNAISIKYNNIPAVGSPSRELMPQTNESDQVLDTIEDSNVVINAEESINFTIEKIN